MNDVLVRFADLAAGQLPLIAVDANGDIVDVGCAVPFRQDLLVFESDGRRRSFGRRFWPSFVRGLFLGLFLRLFGDRERGFPDWGRGLRLAAEQFALLRQLGRLDLLDGELSCRSAAGTMRDVGLDEGVLNDDLLRREIEDAVFIDLIADLAEDIGKFRRCCGRSGVYLY